MSLFSSLLGINDIWFYGISSSWGINYIRQALFLWDNYKLCQYLVMGLVEKKLLFKFGIRAVKRQCDFMGWDIQMCFFLLSFLEINSHGIYVWVLGHYSVIAILVREK